MSLYTNLVQCYINFFLALGLFRTKWTCHISHKKKMTSFNLMCRSARPDQEETSFISFKIHHFKHPRHCLSIVDTIEDKTESLMLKHVTFVILPWKHNPTCKCFIQNFIISQPPYKYDMSTYSNSPIIVIKLKTFLFYFSPYTIIIPEHKMNNLITCNFKILH